MRFTLTAYGRTVLDVAIMETPDDPTELDDDVTGPLIALGFTTQIIEEPVPDEPWYDDE